LTNASSVRSPVIESEAVSARVALMDEEDSKSMDLVFVGAPPSFSRKLGKYVPVASFPAERRESDVLPAR